MKKDTLDDILEFAMENERQAAKLYASLAEHARDPGMKRALEGFAQEELGHLRKLRGVKKGVIKLNPTEQVLDLKIADYIGAEDPGQDTPYADILIFLMKQEKAAYRLYMDLASVADDPDIRDTLLGLAQEEAKHKLRFEIEYDEVILTEN